MPTFLRRVLVALAAFALALTGAVAVASPASAATMTPVINTADDMNPGSLRYAVNEANTTPGADTIVIPQPLLILLEAAEGPLILTEGVTIVAQADPVVIWRDGSFDVFQIQPGASTDQDYRFEGFEIDGQAGQTGRAVLAVATDPGTIVFEGMSLKNLDAAVGGGGAVLVDGTVGGVRFTTSDLSGNTSPLSGGAISVTGPGGFSSDLTTYTNNSAPIGGAVEVTSTASASFDADTFTDNHATGGFGGALAISGVLNDVNIFDADASGNDANGDGGFAAINLTAGNVLISGGEYALNDASSDGGAFWIDEVAANFTVQDAVFDTNSAKGNGGALRSLGAFTMFRSDFVSNVSVNGDGGAISVVDVPLGGGALGWLNSNFIGNEADVNGDGRGGAAYFESIHNTTLLQTSTYSGNAAGGEGIALYVDTVYAPGGFRVYQSTFEESGAGQYVIAIDTVTDEGSEFDAHAGIEYSTIVGPGAFIVNHADTTGSLNTYYTIADASELPAVSSPDGKAIRVVRSLLSTPLTAELVDDESVFDVADMKLGPLQDNGGRTFTRLPQPGSPAIDAGDPDLAFAPDFDQRGPGFPRVINDILDIGAVEAPLPVPPKPELAATGSTGLPVWVPIVGGIVLLAGIAFVVFSAINRRKGAGAAGLIEDSAGEPGPGTGGDAVFPEASTEPPTAEPPAENDPR